jgi:hypothetical protein
MPTPCDGERFDALMAELDGAVGDLISFAGAEPARWTRGRPGKWTAGQHAAHVAITLAETADAFEERLPRVLDGSLAAVPRRGPLQWLWVGLLVGRGTMPRGGRTPRRFEPAPAPGREETEGRLRRGVERHRAAGHRLTAAQRDRLWIPNPFVTRWHYMLPEMVRAQAVHARHHRKLIAEIG